MKKNLLLILSFFLSSITFAQEKNDYPTGWKFGGVLPAISYDSDLGFRYGALGYIFDYGKNYYPNYKKQIYLEWSRTTKGSGNNILQYDDKKFLGSNIRFTSDLSYLIEQALDFYGYNGYQSIFIYDFMNPESSNYKTRMFYRLDRRLLRIKTDFQIPIVENKLRAYTGVSVFNVKINSVNIDKLNEGKPADQLLPSTDSVPGLYEKYVKWNIIPANEKNGGLVTLLKAGIIYDTRDNEAQPTKGLWDEIFLQGNPGFGGSSQYLQLVATHRQYFSLLPHKKLSFAYRIIFQSKLAGNIPFYMLPFYFSSKETKDGFGGAKTARGILRDRVVANSLLDFNAEMRWRVVNFKISSANFYVALSAFLDGIEIVSPYSINTSGVPDDISKYFFNPNKTDIYKPHLSYGGGLRIAYNENMIVAIDYGRANSDQDGTSGLYIGLGWLF